jgi:hypothetical protein
MRLEDTGRFIMPMIEPDNQGVQIKSLMYFGSTIKNTTLCNPIEFMFYDEQDHIRRALSFTPGQSSYDCVDFYNATIVGYAGVTILLPVLEGGVAKSSATISSSASTTSSPLLHKNNSITAYHWRNTTHSSATIISNLG